MVAGRMPTRTSSGHILLAKNGGFLLIDQDDSLKQMLLIRETEDMVASESDSQNYHYGHATGI